MTPTVQALRLAAPQRHASRLETVARYADLFDAAHLAVSATVPPSAPAREEEIVAHLLGTTSLHLFLLDRQGRTRHGVLELDGDGVRREEAVRAELERRGVEAALEEASGGGARLWVFAREPLLAATMRALLAQVAPDQLRSGDWSPASCGNRQSSRSVALYPRSDTLAEGECVVAPLGVSPLDGRRYGFLDERGRLSPARWTASSATWSTCERWTWCVSWPRLVARA